MLPGGNTLLPLLVFLAGSIAAPEKRQEPRQPIMLDRSGGFVVGGKTIESPTFPGMTLSCDHGYMEYFIPWRPRRTGIVMWHSSSTQVWQNRWDGGEGYKDMFLRRGYPVYLWDGPRVGRANWACEPSTYTPSYRDQGNFVAWNFGPEFGSFWPGVQFPTDDEEAWRQATSSRYVEIDTVENVHMQAQAAAVAADDGRLGESVVLLGNSASGLRAQLAAIKSNSSAIQAVVAYESYGCVFPDNANLTGIYPGFPGTPGPSPNGTTPPISAPFGPFFVTPEEFKKLAQLKAVQFVWGDHRDESFPMLRQTRQAAALINAYGGNASLFFLAKDAGLEGSTHSAFADMDNDKVAALLDDFLVENGLDGYDDDEDER
ncbi:hypothetical protein MGN70_003160 [Eutypa lata]|nr:hypothetical protein MGN70_003160 [Eutypa lata]